MSAGKFREYAAEHLDWARTAVSDKERETFEQMARAWLEVGALWEDVGPAEHDGRDGVRPGATAPAPLAFLRATSSDAAD